MILALSNLAFKGNRQPKNLPSDIGLEILYEFGGNHYWEHVIREAYAGRPVSRFSIHGPYIATNLADDYDTEYLTLYEKLFQFAAARQTDYVVVHTNEGFDCDIAQARQRVKRRLTEVLQLASHFRVNVLIENVGLRDKGTLLFDWPDYRELIQALPQAGVLFDVGHAHANHWPLLEVIDNLRDRIAAYHLHDNHGSEDEHLMVSQGTIDWTKLFPVIRSASPEATLVFEYANGDLMTIMANIHMLKDKFLSQG